MKCPYVLNSVSIEKETNEDELSKCIILTTMVDCVKEECGAYQEGKCVRR